MPDLRELRVFVAVAEQLSFTRAAELLHLTQQTVSKTVRDLERELGVELLERTSREVRLTDAGRALLEPGKQTIAQAEEAFAVAREVGGGRAGTVRVGVSPAVGPQDCADVVGILRRDSDRSVALHDVRPAEVLPRLRDRTLDLVLARVSGTAGDALDRAELRPTPMQVHVHRTHALAQSGSARLADFDGLKLLAANPAGTPYTDLLVERFADAGATVTPVEGRVTGGDQLLTDLDTPDLVAVMSAGTPSPESVIALEVDGLTMPLLVVWLAGRVPLAVEQLRRGLR